MPRWENASKWNDTQNMDVREIATNVELSEEGVWCSRTKSAISYPEKGNDICFELEDTSFWFQHRNRCLIETLRRYPPNGVFFDIGGGNGCVALALQNAGWPVVLLEPGARGVRNARGRQIHNVIWSAFQDAGFREGSIAAAGAFDVVEHIQDDSAFLRSMAHSLVTGGRLYLTVPAFRILWSHEDDDAGHYRRYTCAQLTQLLQKAGLEPEYVTYFFSFLPLPILLLRTLPYRLRMRRSQAEVMARSPAEHRAPGGASNSLLQFFQNRELAHIRSGRRMITGSSCLAVARKR
jgi:SAM-dependent methyltransferase